MADVHDLDVSQYGPGHRLSSDIQEVIFINGHGKA
jgi:hypothetical protein